MWQAHARAVESVNAARAREECDAAAHWRYQECRGNRRGVQCMEWSGKLVLVRVCEMCLVIKCSAWRKFEGAGCDAVLSVRCGALLPAIVCYIVVGAQRPEASGRARCRLHVQYVVWQRSSLRRRRWPEAERSMCGLRLAVQLSRGAPALVRAEGMDGATSAASCLLLRAPSSRVLTGSSSSCLVYAVSRQAV